MSDLKNRVRFTSTLPTKMKQDLDSYSKKSMIPITRILEKVIGDYLKAAEK